MLLCIYKKIIEFKNKSMKSSFKNVQLKKSFILQIVGGRKYKILGFILTNIFYSESFKSIGK